MYNQYKLPTLFKRLSAIHLAAPVRLLIIYMGLLTFCAGLYLTADSQIAKSPPEYAPGTDTVKVKRINITELSKPRQQQSREYADFLSKESLGLQPILYPFYPYTPINFKNLPPPPFRLYLGKTTTADKNDFVLIAVACKQTATTGGKPIQYDDDVQQTTKPGSKPVRKTSWTSIRVRKSSAATDLVIYQQINTDTLMRYINNFKSFVKAKKLDMPRRYPLCFVIRDNKSTPQLKIQPILVSKSQVPVTSGGTQHWKKYLFQENRIVSFWGGCCQTPPESGNSVPDN